MLIQFSGGDSEAIYVSSNHGRANAFTVLSHVKPWRSGILRIVLSLLHRLKWTHLTAKQMRFLHFARWTILADRNLIDRKPDPLHGKLLLFCTSYNGDWDDYLGAFSDVLSSPLDLVWKRCERFPGAKPVSGLKSYVRDNDHASAFYHCAYCDASVHDVRQGLDLIERLEEAGESEKPAEQRFAEFAAAVCDALGSPERPTDVPERHSSAYRT